MKCDKLIMLLKNTLYLNDNISQKYIADGINISNSALSQFKRGKLILSDEKQKELLDFLLNI
ncbi:Helix-turn-helix [Dethiosulfatibacter aminovorans DSM 17477]|uniref:Helix-turn-helix n=1 Tax=Dethiosulfatibacter aminovorans DSM 17477 TaxID=1121476 RepID=A0A1M6FZM4_9FIRM|nr:helix-turn-helix transcriptional regulator [Dethiosulfatibacter aminovorans]SHJ03092.1 Helix-turn-helix [Dethiosulfatibacter aminovorans DSM 17477]